MELNPHSAGAVAVFWAVLYVATRFLRQYDDSKALEVADQVLKVVGVGLLAGWDIYGILFSARFRWLYIVLGYLLVLTAYNYLRSKKVQDQDDFMVAGRSLPLRVMVFTLVCTWIGSGTFIAGARYTYKAGLNALWLAAGGWLGIAVIYFLAARIRSFGQYTIGDILELRYGKWARFLGALFVILSFVGIAAYQFKAGGYILNVVTDGAISVDRGMVLTAFFVILFTAMAGMMAVAYTDLPNGILIVLASLVAVPFVVRTGAPYAKALPATHFSLVPQAFGQYPLLKAGGYMLATMFLLLGVQSMYQKFYSAKSPSDARQAVAIWIVGTIVVETVVVVIALYAAARFWQGGHHPDPGAMVLLAARHMVPAPVGILLLAAACAVVLSTGMNYLLSPSTNVVRDLYQRLIAPEASHERLVALQRITVVVLGVAAYLLMQQFSSVLQLSLYAYTIYGTAITPALLAALAWKRATPAGGLASILGGGGTGVALIVYSKLNPDIMLPQGSSDADPWGIPIVYPALAAAIILLVVVSLLTPPPGPERLAPIFDRKEAAPASEQEPPAGDSTTEEKAP